MKASGSVAETWLQHIGDIGAALRQYSGSMMEAGKKNPLIIFTAAFFPGFFLLGVTEGYPTMLATLQGSYVAQEQFKVGFPS